MERLEPSAAVGVAADREVADFTSVNFTVVALRARTVQVIP